jgi:hypothetical protein
MVFQIFAKYFRCNPIAAIIFRDHFQAVGLGNNLPEEFAPAVRMALWSFMTIVGHRGVIRVKAIDKVNLVAVLAQ